MKIEVKAVNRDNSRYSDAPEIKLPYAVEAEKTVEQSLINHPFKKNALNEKTAIIIVYVTVGGSDYYSQYSELPWARIGYQEYLADQRAPIFLHLHLAKYMGIDDSFAIDIPDTQEILKQNMNLSVFQDILYHEFSHLLDAIDPNFNYDQNAREQLRKDQRAHGIFIDLWNAYIDRRLSFLLADYEKNISVTKKSSRNVLNKWLKIVWLNKADYTFLQLVQMAQECRNVL